MAKKNNSIIYIIALAGLGYGGYILYKQYLNKKQGDEPKPPIPEPMIMTSNNAESIICNLIQKRGKSLLLLTNPACRSFKERRTLENNITLIENLCQLLMRGFINKL
jgi:hypothetical protein